MMTLICRILKNHIQCKKKKSKGHFLLNNADLGKYVKFTFSAVFPHLSKNVLLGYIKSSSIIYSGRAKTWSPKKRADLQKMSYEKDEASPDDQSFFCEFTF